MAGMAHIDRHDALLMRIAIVGGGWAGLACATALAQYRHAHPTHPASGKPLEITLFEAAPQCGGRARGLTWNGNAIDNGQHLVMGAYTEFRRLLDTANAPRWHSEPLCWAVVNRDHHVAQRWHVPDQAWPWRALATLLPSHAPIGWPLAWRTALAKTLWTLVRNRWHVAHAYAADWFHHERTPAGLVEHFWKPLAEGALNTPWRDASAQVLATVIRDTLGGPKGATRVLLPPRNLSLDGVDPVVSHLTQRGVMIRCGHRVTGMRCVPSPLLTVRHGDQSREHAFDRVVIALPFQDTLRLWSEASLPHTRAIQRLQHLAPQAITTVWIDTQGAAIKPRHALPTWFVLAPTPGVPHVGQVVVIRDNVLGVVISARNPSDVDRERDMHGLLQQLKVALGIDLGEMACRWITEKSATWGCTPHTPLPTDDDARGQTGLAMVYRCADDLEPGYPATLESAVRSGQRTAHQLLSELG